MLGQRSFDDLSAPLHAVPFCVLDLETTGAAPSTCEITEMGAVKYLGGELAGTFQTLVNPGVPIPPMITVLTGITQIMVVAAPNLGEALPAFLEFIGDSVIVGHNVRFDISFLDAAARRLGYGPMPNRAVDTLALARRLVRGEVRSLKLSSLAAHLRSPVAPTHRALDDARATAHVFWSLLERAGSIGVTHLDDLLRLPTARGAPHYTKIELTDALPRAPGVYLFKDRDGEVIYVGKAKNLRARTRSYFYGDDRRSIAQMLRDLDSIDHRVCPTELEAEIAELRMIHAYRPRYNRRSRPPKSPHWVKLTDEKFPRLSMVRSYGEDGCVYLGPFRSRRHAKIVVDAIWDAIPLRRCLTRGGKKSPACAFSQLGVAVCPCDGSISPDAYRLIVERFERGVGADHSILLDPLEQRMRTHAVARRFEDAATLRDRHRALTTALERRRAWQALQRTGSLWAVDSDGDNIVLDSGRLTASWHEGEGTPMRGLYASADHIASQVPPSMALADEAALVWKWLNRAGVTVVDAESPLRVPRHPLRRLTTMAV